MSPLADASPWLLAGCALGLLAGGLVKGTIGLGLPLVAAPALATLLGVKAAVAVLTLPVLLANVWQALHGGHALAVLRRFWPAIVTLALGVAAGTAAVAKLDAAPLFALLGAVVLAWPLTVFLRIDPTIPPAHERGSGLAVGALAGFLSGLSYFFGPPLAIWLSALRVPKDLFVAAIALIGLIATLLTAAFLAGRSVLNVQELGLSALAAVPTLAGTWLGTRLRRYVDETAFRKAVAVALLAIGANLVRRAFA